MRQRDRGTHVCSKGSNIMKDIVGGWRGYRTSKSINPTNEGIVESWKENVKGRKEKSQSIRNSVTEGWRTVTSFGDRGRRRGWGDARISIGDELFVL